MRSGETLQENRRAGALLGFLNTNQLLFSCPPARFLLVS
jgi:hypothetical protein